MTVCAPGGITGPPEQESATEGWSARQKAQDALSDKQPDPAGASNCRGKGREVPIGYAYRDARRRERDGRPVAPENRRTQGNSAQRQHAAPRYGHVNTTLRLASGTRGGPVPADAPSVLPSVHPADSPVKSSGNQQVTTLAVSARHETANQIRYPDRCTSGAAPDPRSSCGRGPLPAGRGKPRHDERGAGGEGDDDQL